MEVHRMIANWPWSPDTGDWVGGPLNGTIGWGSSVGVQLNWVYNKFANIHSAPCHSFLFTPSKKSENIFHCLN